MKKKHAQLPFVTSLSRWPVLLLFSWFHFTDDDDDDDEKDCSLLSSKVRLYRKAMVLR